jgi:hypothetical protein
MQRSIPHHVKEITRIDWDNGFTVEKRLSGTDRKLSAGLICARRDLFKEDGMVRLHVLFHVWHEPCAGPDGQ